MLSNLEAPKMHMHMHIHSHTHTYRCPSSLSWAFSASSVLLRMPNAVSSTAQFSSWRGGGGVM